MGVISSAERKQLADVAAEQKRIEVQHEQALKEEREHIIHNGSRYPQFPPLPDNWGGWTYYPRDVCDRIRLNNGRRLLPFAYRPLSERTLTDRSPLSSTGPGKHINPLGMISSPLWHRLDRARILLDAVIRLGISLRGPMCRYLHDADHDRPFCQTTLISYALYYGWYPVVAEILALPAEYGVGSGGELEDDMNFLTGRDGQFREFYCRQMLPRCSSGFLSDPNSFGLSQHLQNIGFFALTPGMSLEGDNRWERISELCSITNLEDLDVFTYFTHDAGEQKDVRSCLVDMLNREIAIETERLGPQAATLAPVPYNKYDVAATRAANLRRLRNVCLSTWTSIRSSSLQRHQLLDGSLSNHLFAPLIDIAFGYFVSPVMFRAYFHTSPVP